MLEELRSGDLERDRTDDYLQRVLNSRKKRKIMVIDDDLDHRLIVAEMLVNAGYTVMTAKDGEMGLNTLILNNDKPDLIILDLMMPTKDGLAFRKEQMKTEGISQIPVIFLTGQGYVEGEKCLQKPIDEREVVNTVQQILDV
jgi:DNA-binding response OmpR family regulator